MIGEDGINIYNKKSYITIAVICSALPFIVISSLRYFVGTDYGTYSRYQIPMVLNNKEVKVEILYRYLIKLGNYIYSSNYQVIFILTALLVVLITFKYIYDRSYNVPFSIVMFTLTTFFNFSMNGMRQSIAIALFLFSTKYIVRGKPIPYFITIALAIGFHNSAIVFLPVYFVRNFKLSGIRIPFYLGLIAVILSFKNLFVILVNKLGLYTVYLGSYFSGRDNKILFLNILVLTIVLISIWISKGDILKNNNLNVDINILLYAILVQAALTGIPNSARLFLNFLTISITLVPNTIAVIKPVFLKYSFSVIGYGGFAIYFVYSILIKNFHETLPYVWWYFWK